MPTLGLNRWAALATTLCGLASYFAAMRAERYHNRRFTQHMDRLEALEGDDAAIGTEVQTFAEDVWLDRAAWVMMHGYPIAMAFWALTGAILWFRPF